jgi:hypothetical protein
LHHDNAVIEFNLCVLRQRHGCFEEAKSASGIAIDLDKDIRGLALDDDDLKPLWDWIGGLE